MGPIFLTVLLLHKPQLVASTAAFKYFLIALFSFTLLLRRQTPANPDLNCRQFSFIDLFTQRRSPDPPILTSSIELTRIASPNHQALLVLLQNFSSSARPDFNSNNRRHPIFIVKMSENLCGPAAPTKGLVSHFEGNRPSQQGGIPKSNSDPAGAVSFPVACCFYPSVHVSKTPFAFFTRIQLVQF